MICVPLALATIAGRIILQKLHVEETEFREMFLIIGSTAASFALFWWLDRKYPMLLTTQNLWCKLLKKRGAKQSPEAKDKIQDGLQ